MTTELAEAPTVPGERADATTEPERVLADVLAETARAGSVSVDSHFFDDLGLDSLVIAHFCALVRKRVQLSISVKDCYRHPTIRSLAASLPEDAAARVEPAANAPVEAGTRPGSAPSRGRRHVLAGGLQLLALLAYASIVALVAAAYSEWISAASGWGDVYLRSVVFAGASMLGSFVLPVVAKWTLIGRWKRQEIAIWSLAYVRFWTVSTLIRLNPMVLFAGSPIYLLYLRALGARIGRGAVIFSRHAPVCTDLLQVGAGAVIRKDSFFTGYRAEAGVIRTGPVTIGRDAFIGEATVLDVDTSIGDGAQLAHSSSLHAGQAVPDGERRHGSPAEHRTEANLQPLESRSGGTGRRAIYATVQVLGMVGLSAPLTVGAVHLLMATVPYLDALLHADPADLASWAFYRDALVASLVLFFGVVLAGLLFVGTVPRVLNLAIKPDTAYPLYGFRYAVHRAIARLTNVRFFPYLFGDSSYIVHYLRWLGYDLSPVEQTGSNFGLEVKHETPYLASVGTGTMVADGLSIANADFSSTSFRVSPVRIGTRSFVGNYVAYPSQGRTGDDCLVATKAMVPVDAEVREQTGILGSPSFEIPRSVRRDGRFDHLKRGTERRRRLAAKTRHNTATIGLFLLTRWLYVLGIAAMAGGALAVYDTVGGAAIAVTVALALPFTVAYFALVERAATVFRTLRPRFCSIYERYFWWHERYWKLSTQPPRILAGTPFRPLAWRALGVRIGKRVFDDGVRISEKTLVGIGDDCALNAGSIIQPHSQEDGSFKSDRTAIGAGCTLGVGALVHYGVTMGDGATLAPDSFLMKGEQVPPNARWGMNPATELRRSIAAVAGSAEHRSAVPQDVAAAARGLADEMGMPLSAVLLAAHARVLASVTGEAEVVTGYVAAAGEPPLPCRLDAEADSWRALLRAAARVESELLARRGAADHLHEFGLPEAPFDTVLDPTDDGARPTEKAVLRAGVSERDGELSVRLGYRTDALDADSAARIAGYHVTALRRMAADPDAEPARQSLLSEEELRFQLFELAGPRRELPERRFHELFEERAAANPDAVAAVHRDRRLTYRALNARANRLGRALLARGLRREGVVAVVTERNLDWMAAVLAVFKAGGAYLPIEPHLPADRIAAMLSRAKCELVVTESGSATMLDRALKSLPGVEALVLHEALEENHGDGDLGIDVAPDQLAYIYFTSGSTGEPKGAMCEHAGLLNHLYAKIDDLEIGEGQMVAQTAPQSFDISLWQLVSALLVGGRTMLVEQDVILDVESFVDTIASGRVNVLQVVPSYLELVVSYLEQEPRELPHLRCVSVTGEAVTHELTERWFAVYPEIGLVNAYGLTETSDDTNHEVMRQAPDSDRVPLGPPVNNVRVYVVDEHLSPVPLGAPGEIVFSGVCVGRGYVNDPERTRLAFVADPHREGERLYRSGDYGRWRPDGKLEFLGRRDAQVKIRGFRIEIGEVESALSQVPGIRAAAAVAANGAGTGKRLVAFYIGQRLEAETLRVAIGESLPSYMVPSAFHWRERLPLTANGKVDRKALSALAAEADAV